MDIYKKDKILQQIREQINLNEKNIIQKGGNLDLFKDKISSIKDIYDNFQNYKNDIIHKKKEQEKHILTLLNYLDKSSMEYELTDKIIFQINHERKILMAELEKIRLKLKELINN